MASTKIPTSKAKTAYGLLSDIAKLALEEPKRMRMNIWGGVGYAGLLDVDERPACGTIGCIGGWTNVLRPERSAPTVLGLDAQQEDELFFDTKLCVDPSQGTRTHAKKVARHIARFQKKYAKQLKATKV